MADSDSKARPPVGPLEPARHLIISVPVSPMVELARWLFEREGIPYREDCHAPLLHVLATSRRRGGVEVPVVVSAEATWKGARETLLGLDAKLPPGRRLFGDTDDERDRHKAWLDTLLGRLLLQVRRLSCFHLLPHKRLLYPLASGAAPAWQRAVVWALYPLWRRGMARALDVSPATLGSAEEDIADAFTFVERLLDEKGTPFLGGQQPGPMDIVFAALVGPVTLPPNYGVTLPPLDQLPEGLREIVVRFRSRRAGRLALDTYAQARSSMVGQGHTPGPRRLKRTLLGATLQGLGARAAARWGRPLVLRGTAYVFRWADVNEVLSADLVYKIGPINAGKIEAVAGPFVLGQDRGPSMAAERPALYAAMAPIRLDQLSTWIAGEASRLVADAAAQSGAIDVGYGYARRVAARTAVRLFGLPGLCEADLLRIARALFQYTFLDLGNEPQVRQDALQAAAVLRRWIDDEIARRRGGVSRDDVLGRLMAWTSSTGQPLDDDAVRRNLSGLVIGAIDTTAVAVARVIAVIGADPSLQARVERDLDDRQRLAGWCHEALRMWPHNPILLRQAATPAVLGTKTIPAGTRVIAVTQAAMLDAAVFPEPQRLDPTRPRAHYFNFGGGLHPCAGRWINEIQLPALVGALLRQGLARCSRPRFDGPFLDELVVTFRRSPP